MTGEGALLWVFAVHLVLTAAPGVAATLFAVRQGARSVPVLLAVGLATSGACAMLAFWSYLPDPFVGHTVAYGIFFASVGLIAWSAPALRGQGDLLRQLMVPLALWALGSLFVVYLGFFHGGTDNAIAMSATRFSGQLPSDNDIPHFFANWFFDNGYGGGPPVYPPEWLSSDRPPLQIGYVLTQRIFAWNTNGLHYQVIGVIIQSLWIVGLWALLCAARLRVRTRALAMVAVLVSDVALLHGFFVWPKLLPAAMLLAAFALVLSPQWADMRRDLRIAALLASLSALALLGHGSSVFGLIALALLISYRGLPSMRWIGVGVLVGAVLLVPWSAYQNYGDPPGNRLVKWHLGGATEVDDRGTVEAIVDGYRETGANDALGYKADNALTIVGARDRYFTATGNGIGDAFDGDFEGAIREIREPRFFSVFFALGLFLLAPIAMVAGRSRRAEHPAEWRFALTCFAVAAVGWVAWALLQFGTPDSLATIHVGTLALPILALSGAVAGMRAIFPRLATAVVAVNAVIVLAIYAPSIEPLPGTSYSAVAGLIAAVSLAAFTLGAFRAPGGGPAGSELFGDAGGAASEGEGAEDADGDEDPDGRKEGERAAGGVDSGGGGGVEHPDADLLEDRG